MRTSPLPKIDELPPTIGVGLANQYLGIGRSKGYELLRAGRYPVRTLQVGERYRVITSDLRRALGMEGPPPAL